MELTKLNDVYKNWDTGDGVFTDLNEFDVPWKDENNITGLNMAYHGSHSGDKNISPVVYKFLSKEDANARGKLASIIFTMFADKWAKLWSALEIEYDPLNNYDMVEHETPAEITHTITPAEIDTTTTPAGQTVTHKPAETTETETPTEYTETHTPAETTETITPAETTETVTPAETTTTTKPAKTTTENEISAFNSSGYVDDAKTTVTGDNNDKGSEAITVQHAGTNALDVDTAGSNKFEVDTAGSDKFEVDTAGTRKTTVDSNETTTNVVNSNGVEQTRVNSEGSDVLTVQNERILTRSGNIGVTTSQQMLQSEIELRKWLYYQSVFNDIDTILTLSIY